MRDPRVAPSASMAAHGRREGCALKILEEVPLDVGEGA